MANYSMRMISKLVLVLYTGLISIQSSAQPIPQVAVLINQVSQDSLTKTVTELSGQIPILLNNRLDTIATRQFNLPGNEKAFIYLKQRLLSYGISIDSQVFSSNGKNLFGIIRGADTNQLIILGAHYDGKDGISGFGPAADDNASGVAAVIECARLCKNSSLVPTVVFALWDEEEIGSVGSAAYVQQKLVTSNKTLLGYINLDMLGWDSNIDSIAEVHVRYTNQSPAWGARVLTINNDYNIGLQMRLVNPGNGATDVVSFWNANYTAIGIAEDYTNDLCPYRHSMNDTAGGLNMPFLRKNTQLTLATLLEYSLAQSATSVQSSPFIEWQVSPNPFTNKIDLQFVSRSTVQIVIVDALGRRQYERKIESPSLIRIYTSDWNMGIYQLIVHQNGHPVFQQRLVKSK